MLCDGGEYKYKLSEIQCLSTLQVVSELVEKTDNIESEDDASVCIVPRNKVPVNMRQLKNWQTSRDATIGMSLHITIPLSIIAMGKTRSILSFQDPGSASVN